MAQTQLETFDPWEDHEELFLYRPGEDWRVPRRRFD
jgi:hypothetical protein